MDIPIELYKLFLLKVREIFAREAKKRDITLTDSKVKYWEAQDEEKHWLMHLINFGTNEVRHFYDRERRIRKKSKGDIFETDKVVVHTLYLAGINLPHGWEVDDLITITPTEFKEAAEIMFENFREGLPKLDQISLSDKVNPEILNTNRNDYNDLQETTHPKTVVGLSFSKNIAPKEYQNGEGKKEESDSIVRRASDVKVARFLRDAECELPKILKFLFNQVFVGQLAVAFTTLHPDYRPKTSENMFYNFQQQIGLKGSMKISVFDISVFPSMRTIMNQSQDGFMAHCRVYGVFHPGNEVEVYSISSIYSGETWLITEIKKET